MIASAVYLGPAFEGLLCLCVVLESVETPVRVDGEIEVSFDKGFDVVVCLVSEPSCRPIELSGPAEQFVDSKIPMAPGVDPCK